MKVLFGALGILGLGGLAYWYFTRPGTAAQANAGTGGVVPQVGGAPGPSLCQALVTAGGTAGGAYAGVPPVAGAGVSAALAKPICEMGSIVKTIASGVKSGAEATAHAIGFGASKAFEATTTATIAAAKATGATETVSGLNDLAHLKVGAGLSKLVDAPFQPIKTIAGFAPKPVANIVQGAASVPGAIVSGGAKVTEAAGSAVVSGAKAVGSGAKSVAKKLCFFC